MNFIFRLNKIFDIQKAVKFIYECEYFPNLIFFRILKIENVSIALFPFRYYLIKTK